MPLSDDEIKAFSLKIKKAASAAGWQGQSLADVAVSNQLFAIYSAFCHDAKLASANSCDQFFAWRMFLTIFY